MNADSVAESDTSASAVLVTADDTPDSDRPPRVRNPRSSGPEGKKLQTTLACLRVNTPCTE